MNANLWRWCIGIVLLFVVAGCVAVQPENPNLPETEAPSEATPADPGETATVPVPGDTLTSTVEATGTVTTTPTSVSPLPTPTLTTTPIPTGSTPIPTGATPETPEPPETATVTPPPTTAPTATPMPSPTPTEGVPPTPTSLPEAVFIGPNRSFTEGSDLYVVGEVVNGAGQPVYNVTIIATFVDPGGQIVGAQQDVTLLPKTDPTLHNPFKLRLPNAPATINEYQLNLTWDDISIAEFDRVTILSENVQTDGGVVISGELRNDHRGEVRNVVVAATFYDASGNVINVYRGQVDAASLAPGESTTYTVQTSSSLIDYDHVLIQTQGLLVR